MPEYIFDHNLDQDTWKALDEFTRGYIEAAFWLGDEEEGIPDMGLHDLAREALDKMQADCADFQQANAGELESAWCERGGDYDGAHAGHDFWLTRNHHGAGFWDRGLGKAGDALTKAAHAYGESDLYCGDDGKVYVT